MEMKILQRIAVIVIIGLAAFGCAPGTGKKEIDEIHRLTEARFSGMEQWLDSGFIPLAGTTTDTAVLKRSYREGRRQYKEIAFLVEYFYPSSSRFILGPALDEIEAQEHQVSEPGGFQVMEESLFTNAVADTAFLKREARKMRSLFFRLHGIWTQETFRDDQVFDAIRTDIARMTTLQLTGFDAPVSLEGLQEIPVSLGSYQEVLNIYRSKVPGMEKADKLITAAGEFAARYQDFDAFPRLEFITWYLNPLSATILHLQEQAGIPVLNNIGALNMAAPHIFTDSSIRQDFFIPDATSAISKQKVQLGRKLFYDPVLSNSNSISCASCHLPEKAFTDGLTTSPALGSKGNLKRNTPTLFYAGLQKAQFMDLRVAFLEDQVKDVVESKDEIHGNMDSAARKMSKDPEYSKLFAAAFPGWRDSISTRQVQVALASFIRSLNPFRSAFDLYLNGDTTQLSASQQRGFDLFAGKAKCATCHFVPLFNGTVPPAFAVSEGEVLGVMDKPGSANIDPDQGRYAIYKIDNFRHAFKTPTLRNISLTAPYMHQGGYRTLEEVLAFYNSGGAAGRGISLQNQTLPADSLRLSKTEISDIIHFMEALSDPEGTRRF
ncbi:cytochrome-c peroxidase [Flavihumibacter solisilvae]|uniref:cytochrome-c peroxidase n=1 Tax=Flavihumibacter solisilvae TaxID=1349421 RepID=UPI00068C1105|nr:cytochrome c peroxidase [Flavihumibacter solisilvae]